MIVGRDPHMKQHDKATSGYGIAKQENPLQIHSLRNCHPEALKYKKFN